METNIKELNEMIRSESAFIDVITAEMDKVIVGQKHMVERLLIGLLTRGHVLLEGVPDDLFAFTLSVTVAGIHQVDPAIQSLQEQLSRLCR